MGQGQGGVAGARVAQRSPANDRCVVQIPAGQGSIGVAEHQVAGSITVAVNGTLVPAAAFVSDIVNGTITFQPNHIPAASQTVSAGFLFDVPVRFDTDKLEINLSGFRSGAIPAIPLVEVRV